MKMKHFGILLIQAVLVSLTRCKTTFNSPVGKFFRGVERKINDIGIQINLGFDLIHDTNGGSRICNWKTPLEQGVCFDPAVCWALGGNFIGIGKPVCAGLPQFSQCCQFVYGCNRESEQTLSYFQGENVIVHDHVPCSLTVRGRLGVCQLRADFIDLSLKDPDSMGRCDKNHELTIISPNLKSGGLQRSGSPVSLCGNNSGTHLYLPLAENEKIKFELRNRGGKAMSWLVRLIQVDCRATRTTSLLTKLKAPEGCLQYFIRPDGLIRSFNFASASESMSGNRDYTICFRQNRDHCSLSVRARTFNLGKGAQPCTKNYIGAVGVHDGSKLLDNDRLCGTTLGPNQMNVNLTSKPFVMRVKSTEDGGSARFALSYELTEC